MVSLRCMILAVCASGLTYCGSSKNSNNEITALAALALLAPACPGTCYDFNDSSELSVESGLTFASGSLSGSGRFVADQAFTDADLWYEITFTLQTGGSLQLHYGNPAAGASATYFDGNAEGHSFLFSAGAVSTAIDPAANTDTMPSGMTAQAATAGTMCLETHYHNAPGKLHMVGWNQCAVRTTASSTYNSGDTAKGGTAISTAAVNFVSGGRIGVRLTNASIDRLVVQKKPQ